MTIIRVTNKTPELNHKAKIQIKQYGYLLTKGEFESTQVGGT